MSFCVLCVVCVCVRVCVCLFDSILSVLFILPIPVKSMLGCETRHDFFIVVGFMENGNMRDFLRECRDPNMSNMVCVFPRFFFRDQPVDYFVSLFMYFMHTFSEGPKPCRALLVFQADLPWPSLSAQFEHPPQKPASVSFT